MKEKAIVIDVQRHTVHIKGKPIVCPNIEFRILLELAKARGFVLTREALIEKIWPDQLGLDMDIYSVNQHICRMRKRFGSWHPLIETVYKVGFKILEQHIELRDYKAPVVATIYKCSHQSNMLYLKLPEPMLGLKKGDKVQVAF